MPSRLLRRALPALLVPVLALALSACAGSSTPTGSGAASATPGAASTACIGNGSASDAVQATGAIGTAPNVKFAAGLTTPASQRTVVSAGSGPAVQNGDLVGVYFSFYNASSGSIVGATQYDATGQFVFTVGDSQIIQGLSDIVRCTPVGSRVVGVINEASLGESAAVFVIDVVQLVPTQASGTAQPAPSGFPTATFAANGQPTVTMPQATPPTTTQVATLIAGSGPTVASGDTVTVQYQGAIWATGKVFDQSWGRAPTSFATNQVIAGFTKALVGQQVGSRVMVIIPPADGYGSAGQSSAGISGTDTLVFTIDILATTAVPSSSTATPTPAG